MWTNNLSGGGYIFGGPGLTSLVHVFYWNSCFQSYYFNLIFGLWLDCRQVCMFLIDIMTSFKSVIKHQYFKLCFFFYNLVKLETTNTMEQRVDNTNLPRVIINHPKHVNLSIKRWYKIIASLINVLPPNMLKYNKFLIIRP